jgi:hypothetical protein
MIQTAGGARFAAEARQLLAVGSAAQDLERDIAPQARIRRPVDLTHPARAEQLDDLVRSQLIAGRQRGARLWWRGL